MNLFKELKSGSAGKIQVGQSLHTMSTALKDNTTLRFAVITGCLKIAKESIFTGTNNFVSDTIAATGLDEYFGFTQDDIDKMLQDADIDAYAAEVKEFITLIQQDPRFIMMTVPIGAGLLMVEFR